MLFGTSESKAERYTQPAGSMSSYIQSFGFKTPTDSQANLDAYTPQAHRQLEAYLLEGASAAAKTGDPVMVARFAAADASLALIFCVWPRGNLPRSMNVSPSRIEIASPCASAVTDPSSASRRSTRDRVVPRTRTPPPAHAKPRLHRNDPRRIPPAQAPTTLGVEDERSHPAIARRAVHSNAA